MKSGTYFVVILASSFLVSCSNVRTIPYRDAQRVVKRELERAERKKELFDLDIEERSKKSEYSFKNGNPKDKKDSGNSTKVEVTIKPNDDGDSVSLRVAALDTSKKLPIPDFDTAKEWESRIEDMLTRKGKQGKRFGTIGNVVETIADDTMPGKIFKAARGVRSGSWD